MNTYKNYENIMYFKVKQNIISVHLKKNTME